MIDITLFKGGGEPAEREVVLKILPKEGQIAKQLSHLTQKVGMITRGHRGYDAYYIEQASFVLSLLPHIQREKPDVIYFSDQSLGDLLSIWRTLTKQRYKLLFCDGAPMSPYAPRCDHIQHLAPIYLQKALDKGCSPISQSLIPYGLNISPDFQPLTPSEKELLRKKLGLPETFPLVLSVAAINKYHKRADYLIKEVASLPEPRPYLLLVGQQDSESREVIELGNKFLGRTGFEARTVPYREVANYYKIADCFVLASLSEGLPRVLIEAMACGLPCLAHDYDVPRFILGEEGYFADFTQSGTLATLITEVLQENKEDASKRIVRHLSAYERFSWEKLRPSYVEMIHTCVKSS
ncbi:glycosyltransferase family 4 protein [Leptothermofonsia sp. ETS-13]|uniref:glycosyltransferase family 4 protein n=1 Tax=Leptothermofonsia sp. ETS-13 TaxID=3035696 RepID=UPI003BA0E8BA